MSRRPVAVAAALALCAAFPARAQQTLPKGRWRILLQQVYAEQPLPSFAVPHLVDEETARQLLSHFGPLLDLSPHDLSLETPGMSFSGSAVVTASAPEIDYGITDWLTVSAIVPWYEVARTLPQVNASGVAIGYNAGYDPRQPISLANFPFAVPSSTLNSTHAVAGSEAAQQIYMNVLGYHRAQRFDDYGLGDPYLALTFAALKRPSAQATGTVWMQLPLGRVADADNPFAIPFGDGHASLGGRFAFQDLEARPLAVTLGVRGLAAFRDHPILRLYKNASLPLTALRERVSRLTGPQVGAFLGVSRTFLGVLRPEINVNYDYKFRDWIRASVPEGEYSGLLDNSKWGMFGTDCRLTYTTVDSYLQGRTMLPYELSLAWDYQVVDHGLFAGLGQHRIWLSLANFF